MTVSRRTRVRVADPPAAITRIWPRAPTSPAATPATASAKSASQGSNRGRLPAAPTVMKNTMIKASSSAEKKPAAWWSRPRLNAASGR